MKRILEIVLLIIIVIVAYTVPYIQWEVFSKPSTLFEFDNRGFVMICVLLAITIIALIIKKTGTGIKLVMLLYPIVIIYYLYCKTKTMSALLPDGTEVFACREKGYYLITYLLLAYVVINIIDYICYLIKAKKSNLKQ